MKKLLLHFLWLALALCGSGFLSPAFSQGTWKSLTNPAPDSNEGVMLLLTDGRVMCLTQDSSGTMSQEGNIWDLLTPDSTGSYANGTWTQLPRMRDTRLYCASWVMPDGNVYIAGGEYGIGYSSGEVYNTNTQTWTSIPGVPFGWYFFDGVAENLYDGNILHGIVYAPGASPSVDNLIYNETGNIYSIGPQSLGSHDEVSWIKLPDSSILSTDLYTEHTERYIPKLNEWLRDSDLKNYVTDHTIYEMGPGFLLPNGNVFILSDTTYTAIYTPSGDTNKGTWIQGPAMPMANGVQMGCPDAPSAMMPDGNILCSFGPAQTYNLPVYFYEFNYLNNTFTQINAPTGGDSLPYDTVYEGCMLDLPDGTVLYSQQYSNRYYQYIPSGTPLAAGKPTIDNIIANCPNFKITGKLFNGITEGAAYGDDWQMATNYPIVRLTNGTRVYYAKTTNWNRVGAIMTGSAEDTADFLIPPMPVGAYSVEVIANGNASAPYSLTLTCSTMGVQQIPKPNNTISVSPNPSNGKFMISIMNNEQGIMIPIAIGIEVYNMLGEKVYYNSAFNIQHSTFDIDLSSQSNGIYLYRVLTENGQLLGEGKIVLNK